MEKNIAWCEVHTIMYKENVLGLFKKHILEKNMFFQAFRGVVLRAILICKIPLTLAVFSLQPVLRTVRGFCGFCCLDISLECAICR